MRLAVFGPAAPSPWRGSAAALVALATVMAGTTAAAGSGSTDSAARTASIDLTIDGRGYGHGRGMSQYGAQGAALQGRSARQILDFYYPDTSAGQVRGRVRVLLTTPTSAPGLTVRPQPGLTVRRVATGAEWELPALAGVSRWRLRWTSSATTTLQFLRDGAWHPAPRSGWRSIGGAAEFFGGGPVELYRKDSPSSYRGVLRTYGGSPADMEVVNMLRFNPYLFGVVPRESPASWQPAALQAQSVAARTYAQFHRARARAAGAGYDLCDTTSCQVYAGHDAEVDTTNAAVRATSGVIRTYHGKPIIAEFSSSNGGQVVGTSVPYQKYKFDPYDNDVNPYTSWTTRVDGDTVADTWNLGQLRDVRVLSRDGHGYWGGRVTSLRLVGSSRSVTVSGDSFRFGLGLRSTYLRFR